MLVTALIVVAAGFVLAAGFALWKMYRIFRLPLEHEKLKRIAGYVADGAMAFLGREYQFLIPVILVAGVFLWIANRGEVLQYMGVTFAAGALFSALSGFVGMKTATKANARTTHAAQTGLGPALTVSFSGGAVTGMAVIALALLGMLGVFAVTLGIWGSDTEVLKKNALPLMAGFSLGASAFALFARVGGGIFTKAADVGADLVGKLEAGIPEDDHRNPAVIADNVGDNVGDLAGMGADLFSSFVGALTGALILGFSALPDAAGQEQLVTLPLVLAALGVVSSLIGILMVRVKEGKSVQSAINRGSWTAVGAAGILALPLIWFWVPSPLVNPLGLWAACLVGLAAGTVVGLVTEHFTAQGRSPVKTIVRASSTGAATNLITGMGVGMMSTFPLVATLFAAVISAYALAGSYGVALAALGMLVPLGIQMAVSAYGPIADNAGGLAEMAEFPSRVREVTDKLDSVGNTTSAIGKGYAIVSTALTAIVLFTAFRQSVGLKDAVELLNIQVISGLVLGGMIPYIFASWNMSAIGKAAFAMIEEVRRQFREKPGILNETELPDYKACVGIATTAALQEMVMPGLIAVLAPVITGFLGGVPMLMGLLCGTMVSGTLLALFMANTGGAWDNTKKTLEAEGGKGTDAHKAAVVGDTVGDPFKDTAGPSLNILIKLMAMVALVLAPILKTYWGL